MLLLKRWLLVFFSHPHTKHDFICTICIALKSNWISNITISTHKETKWPRREALVVSFYLSHSFSLFVFFSCLLFHIQMSQILLFKVRFQWKSSVVKMRERKWIAFVWNGICHCPNNKYCNNCWRCTFLFSNSAYWLHSTILSVISVNEKLNKNVASLCR